MSHYDVDVYCKKCGGYWYSYMDKDPYPKQRVCQRCSEKIKTDAEIQQHKDTFPFLYGEE